MYFAQGRWNEALGAYRVAMDIGEQLYRAGLSTTSKIAEVSESAALYSDAAFAAVRCGKPTEALLILEQGKTRLLTEALRLRVRHPPHVPDAIWNAFEQAGATVRTLQAEKLDMATERHNYPVQAYEMRAQAGRAANAALDAAIADVRSLCSSIFWHRLTAQRLRPSSQIRRRPSLPFASPSREAWALP